MITECQAKSLQFDDAATKTLLALCQPATNDRLKEILGAAYNARYMSIDRPAEFSTTTDGDDFSTPKLMTNDSLLKRPQLKPKNRPALEDRMLSDGPISASDHPTSSKAAFAVSADFRMLRNFEESYRSKRHIKFPSGRKLHADAPGFAQPVKPHLPWTCSQEIRWVDLGADYFPRYLRAVHCTSDRCFYGHYFCRPKAFTIRIKCFLLHKFCLPEPVLGRCIFKPNFIKVQLAQQRSFIYGPPFRVLRLIPQSEDQLDILLSLWKNASFYNLNFWQEPRKINANVDVMVNSKAFTYLTKMFNDTGLGYNVTIGNVKKLILENNAKNERFRKWSRRFKDESSNSPSSSFNLASYNSYDDIVKYLMAIQSEFPFISQVINIGKSHENRQLLVLKIGRPTGNFKRSIWIDAGIHAREWITPATALYFINQLVKKYETDPKIKAYVDQLDWYIMPLVNPDGYEYTRQSVDPKVRLWRKNRSPPICRQSRWGQECCQGVDLNRNFDFHFGEIGASTNPCEEIFSGSNAFSEPETRAIADFILPRQSAFYAFVTLHSEQNSKVKKRRRAVRYNKAPKKAAPRGTAQYLAKSVAEKAARALRTLYNTKYIVGTGADTLCKEKTNLLHPASGGSDDWAKLNAGIKFVYLIELRPEDNRWDGFILTEDQILPTARETWEGMKSVADAVVKYGVATDEKSFLQFQMLLNFAGFSHFEMIKTSLELDKLSVRSRNKMFNDLEKMTETILTSFSKQPKAPFENV
uniref:Peptidase M14 carboxypeptidase A domain-containing protein n=1 Tax=Romanomermis culicivorax TaxID=13658 RepID=A0A915L8G2_ROMCU